MSMATADDRETVVGRSTYRQNYLSTNYDQRVSHCRRNLTKHHNDLFLCVERQSFKIKINQS
jgi:hypothetical protein